MTQETKDLYDTARKTILHTAFHSDVLDERDVCVNVLSMLFCGFSTFSFQSLEKCRPFVRAAVFQVLADFGRKGWPKAYDILPKERIVSLLRALDDAAVHELGRSFRKNSKIIEALEATLPESERSAGDADEDFPADLLNEEAA